MKTDKASRTAQYMALYRAMETQRPPEKRLFTDPYAIYFLDRGFRLACRLIAFAPFERLFYRIIQRRIPGALASGLARTRYIDDLLDKTLREGARQVIILGAGFDTRALRMDNLRQVPVIEVDHPNTARSKLAVLKKASREDGPRPRYLQIDFNLQELDELFREHGVDCTVPTTLLWEGVTNYLEKDAIDRTLTLAGKFPKGSYIIFTYVDQKVLDAPASFWGAERLLKDLAEIEEKWTFGFAPPELPAYLSAFGLTLLEDSGAADYREKYLPERKAILKGYEFYRVAMAGVSAPGISL